MTAVVNECGEPTPHLSPTNLNAPKEEGEEPYFPKSFQNTSPDSISSRPNKGSKHLCGSCKVNPIPLSNSLKVFSPENHDSKDEKVHFKDGERPVAPTGQCGW